MSKKEKKCNSCGDVKPVEEFYRQYKNDHPNWNCYDSYCIPCRLNYGNDRRLTLKRLAVEYKGGMCIDCKLETENYCVYDFHHVDTNKAYCISASARGFETLKKELDKCILLCANCHRIRHSY